MLDGQAVARTIQQEIRAEVDRMAAAGLRRPGLAAVLVGDDPASRSYVRAKERASQRAGFLAETVALPATSSTDQLLEQLRILNARPEIHGILVQLPLPRHLARSRILDAIAPDKDVDGLTSVSAGLLALGTPRFTPATPTGILELLGRVGLPVAGQHAVIVGRSNLVGKPLALLFLQHDATVSICHTKTRRLSELTRQADILVAAAGRPGMVVGEMVKPGAVVIDVGTSRVDGQLLGDVDRRSVEPVAGYLTRVPGGVGPLTVAMLLRNTLQAARQQQEGIPVVP
jgi:methylenetetrahydrofolate dehydrogenase (NADP+)/methenyltetrahydrofolate cyclohydrolase